MLTVNDILMIYKYRGIFRLHDHSFNLWGSPFKVEIPGRSTPRLTADPPFADCVGAACCLVSSGLAHLQLTTLQWLGSWSILDTHLGGKKVHRIPCNATRSFDFVHWVQQLSLQWNSTAGQASKSPRCPRHPSDWFKYSQHFPAKSN
jgi:hypothetical protein